ncbi:structural protein [Pseudomonas phage vB_PaeM_PA5oct]|uniref:Structural protein n=1 Tax=Pseudomonas phage vB_PaeM_PA5oct TaxID=2163605 RepID=A0A4Y5JY82_9CAUD|nr:minor tail protein [Pseudomonas phage vB_PaeM_PA5oct]QCG76183.1 structural protein [Pseudomonas phage vB_PaeM_PA5oct]
MSNLNDFFGSSGSEGGGAEVKRLDDLVDVSVASPTNGQTLVFDNTGWVNRKLSYNDLSNLPSISNTLSGLDDVDTAGTIAGYVLQFNGIKWVGMPASSSISLDDLSNVAITAPSINQTLLFNGSTWYNGSVDFNNLINTPVIPTQLGDLSDVSVSASTQEGSVLVFRTGQWIGSVINYNDLSNTPTIPQNNSFTFLGLSDTNDIPEANGFLKWNNLSTEIEYVTSIPSSAISGLANVATTGLLSNLVDVNVNGVSNGQVLTYNSSSSTWVPTTPSTGGGVSDPTAIFSTDGNTYINTEELVDELVLKTGPSSGNVNIILGGGGKIVVEGQSPEIISETSLKLTGSNLYLNELSWPTTDGTSGQVLATDGNGNLSFITVSSGGTTILINWRGEWEETSYNINDAVSYAGSSYICVAEVAGGDISVPPSNTNLNWNILALKGEDGSFFTYTGTYDSNTEYVDKDVVYYNGSSYVVLDGQGPITGITPTDQSKWGILALAGSGGTGSGFTYKNEYNNSETYQDQDVVSYGGSSYIVSPGNGPVTGILPTDSSIWGIIALKGQDGSGTGNQSLEDLTDVSSATPTSGNVLVANGSSWSSSKLSYSQLQGLPTLSVVATSGSYNDLLDKPSNTGTFIGLSDTDTPSLPNGFLKWNAQGTSISYVQSISSESISGLATVATTGDYSDLTNTPNIPVVLDDLTDVNLVTPPVTGQALVYNGTYWLAGNAGSGSSTLASLTDVNLTTPTNNQVLSYDNTQNLWINTQIDYDDILNTPSIPVNNSFSLVGLNDTDNSAIPNAFLKWNSTGNSVEYVQSISASSITGLSTVATTGDYNDLTNLPSIPENISDLNDVDTSTAPTDGQILIYSAALGKWIPGDQSGTSPSPGGFPGEWLKINYTPGNLIGTIECSPNISYTIVDNVANNNLTLDLVFANRPYPPAGWMWYGYLVTQGRYVLKMQDTTSHPHTLELTTTENPFGTGTGKLSGFQCRVSTTGAQSYGPLQPTHAYVIFGW